MKIKDIETADGVSLSEIGYTESGYIVEQIPGGYHAREIRNLNIEITYTDSSTPTIRVYDENNNMISNAKYWFFYEENAIKFIKELYKQQIDKLDTDK